MIVWTAAAYRMLSKSAAAARQILILIETVLAVFRFSVLKANLFSAGYLFHFLFGNVLAENSLFFFLV